MVRKCLLLLVFSLTCMLTYAQTSIAGKVTDAESGEELPFADITIEKNGVQITGTSTDLEGNFKINLDPGTYDVLVSFAGYKEQRIEGVRIIANKANRLDAQLSAGVLLGEAVVIEYAVPLVEADNTQQGQTITSKEIRQLPTRNINALAATTAGLSSTDEGGAINVRGSRSNATNYFLDGIRVFGTLPPETEIDQLQVITGGIGAQYGDVTGGIISITTKGPSSRFAGGIDFETSGIVNGDNYVGLDQFGQSLIGANLSGPILKNSEGRSILGYRFSGRYTYQRDDDPPATGDYVVKDEVRDEIAANPMSLNSAGSLTPTAQALTDNDVELLDFRPDEDRRQYDLTAKIDARISDDIDITFTGTYNRREDQFTPGGWRLLNSFNNPVNTSNRYRGIFRFRQRFSGQREGGAETGIIRNFEYTLQAGFERGNTEVGDPRHDDRFFDYGYVGSFDLRTTPSIQATDAAFDGGIFWRDSIQTPFGVFVDSGYVGHVGYNQGSYFGYTPNNTINPGLANYNNTIDPLEASLLNEFPAQNGQFLNGSGTTQVWGLYTNINQVYNLYQKTETDVITGNARVNFDLYPGGTDKGGHSISLGFLYEQRVQRSYSINPRELWILARQRQNNHISGIDINTVVGQIAVAGEGIEYVNNDDDPIADVIIGENTFVNISSQSDNFNYIINPTLTSVPLYDVLFNQDDDALFYKRIRDRLGLGLNEYINIDGLSTDLLDLSLFAPKEITDYANGIINFYGYDYLGERTSGDVTFQDFFTQRATEDGIEYRTMAVAPLRPIYMAGYIEDKFTFKDLIFRVGVRVDRWDANTQVLKDPFSLYEIIGAGDFFARFGGDRPSTIGDDFKVYVDDRDSDNPNVVAYRNGEQWFFPNGTQANNGQEIFLNTDENRLVTPFYAEEDPTKRNIQSANYDPSISFEDYEVQWNVMPRLAFSFPISDVANFFAHYDILVQRPNDNTIFTALDYFYFTDPGRFTRYNNPNLRPQRTIDYEVGFQQRLSQSSAIKIAAYYREIRDMIQSRLFQFLPSDQLSQYEGFDNLDFGTVKGFTFSYDLRRTNNFQLTANYTLQFADGTGSNPTSSSRALRLTGGNLRTLFPLSFDERHTVNIIADYRYGSGKKYNGPRLFGADIFADAGINLQGILVSGRPYSQTSVPAQFGGVEIVGTFNGSRLPWRNTINLRIDKNFRLTKNTDAKRPIYLNLYFRVQNLLDTRNVLGVYTATGSPDDDGFLASPLGQNNISDIQRAGNDVNAYTAAYNWVLLNPNFYSLPRRMYIGGLIEF